MANLEFIPIERAQNLHPKSALRCGCCRRRRSRAASGSFARRRNAPPLDWEPLERRPSTRNETRGYINALAGDRSAEAVNKQVNFSRAFVRFLARARLSAGQHLADKRHWRPAAATCRSRCALSKQQLRCFLLFVAFGRS